MWLSSWMLVVLYLVVWLFDFSSILEIGARYDDFCSLSEFGCSKRLCPSFMVDDYEYLLMCVINYYKCMKLHILAIYGQGEFTAVAIESL